ncbi:hypothetical protein FISHEDRAFT_68426 [Fistulina hepatica ATCC 64428]|uniref:Uncharacterized protein n=1 Tax=Fistulina hepatica ATCC 64428 TaxID=1128425 RepID=A0A0D7ARA4_9AGAR|nr:hypothetical protein FISHEDRAFT_68426 [Fistulina hepatica ATCC 64428]
MNAPRPIPDMRFEPRYLSTIAPFVRVRHTSPTAEQEKSSAAGAPGALQKSVELDIQWSQVVWVTLRDQFMFPFLQGLAIQRTPLDGHVHVISGSSADSGVLTQRPVAVLQVSLLSLHPLFVILSSITDASPLSVGSDTPVPFNPCASTAAMDARLSSHCMPPPDITAGREPFYVQDSSNSAFGISDSPVDSTSFSTQMQSAASSTFTSATAPSFTENLGGDLTVLKALNTRNIRDVISRLPNAAPTTICDNATVPPIVGCT